MSSEDRLFNVPFNGVVSLADGAAITVSAQACAVVTIIAGAGATVTYSRVDSKDASAHVTGTENGTTVAANTRSSFTADWPFFRISVAGGPCRFWVG